jgi:hypothetical protein
MSDEVPGTSTPATPQLNPRRAAMASIAQQAHELQSKDLAQFDENTGDVIAPAVEDRPPEDSVTPEPAAVAAPVAPVAEKRIIKLVVDGQAIEVDEERVLEAGRRTLQKESAADRRLAEANDLLKRARAQASHRDPEPPADTQAPSDDVPRDAKQATPVDPVALEQWVEQKLYQRDAVKAVNQFKKDFPDIVGDEFLFGMAAQLEDRRLRDAAALGEPLGDPLEAYRKHGEEVRRWAQSKGMQAPGAPQAAPSRTEAKRAIVAVPGVGAKAPTPAEKKPLSVSDQIEQMRLQRGRRTVQT